MVWTKGCKHIVARDLLVSGTFICMSSLLLVAASCQTCRILDTIPPPNLTETRLLVTHDRIQDFWKQCGKVPVEPADLPVVKNRDCSLTDGWGRELHWDSDGVSNVKVWSLGRDGKPGGTGEDADTGGVFVGRRKRQDDLPTLGRTDVPP